MKNNKVLLPLVVLGLLTLGGGVASAHGNDMGWEQPRDADMATLFQKQATLLGISVDEVKNAWASNKDMMDLAKEKGINLETLKVKIDQERQVERQDRLKKEVAAGKITQAEADKIIAEEQARKTQMDTQLAGVLGITVSDLQAYQNAGKSIDTIISEKGLSKETVFANLQKIEQANRVNEETNRVQALVTKGIITQDQANKKIETLKTQSLKNPKKMGGDRGIHKRPNNR